MVRILVNRPARQQTMTMLTSTGRRYSMQATPPRFSTSEIATFGQLAREGKKPVTRKTAQGLRTLSFTHRVASLDWTVDIEKVLRRFTDHAAAGDRVRFTGGSGSYESPCWWHIKNLTVNVIQRATNNSPSHAELSWDLEEAVDVTVSISKPPPPPPRKPPVRRPTPTKQPAYRTHRVVRGDTLWAISLRYLGRATRYPEIFNLNRSIIKNPNLIYPGQVFRIPGR